MTHLAPSTSLQIAQFHSFLWLIHSSADGRLGCFHVLAVVSQWTINLHINGIHLNKIYGRKYIFFTRYIKIYPYFLSMHKAWREDSEASKLHKRVTSHQGLLPRKRRSGGTADGLRSGVEPIWAWNLSGSSGWVWPETVDTQPFPKLISSRIYTT